MDPNPYRSPAAATPGPATAAAGRPASLVVFGILNIVFGILGLCGTAGSAAMFFVEMPRDPLVPNPALELMESDATYRIIMQVMIALGAVAAVVLLAAGVGLLRSKSWGRTLSMAYGWYAIVGAIVGMLVHWLYLVQPLVAKMDPAFGPAEAATVGVAVSGFLGGCLGMIYPVILLVFMSRPALRAALGAGPQVR
jgi:hypothetical protein